MVSNSVGELGGNSNYQLRVAGSPGSAHRNLVKKVLSGLASSGRGKQQGRRILGQ